MAPTTPLRAGLQPASSLQTHVKDGLRAVKNPHRAYIDAEIRDEFADSLDLDAALLKGRERENRWDYLLGHAQVVIGLEPHSAENGEISTVINKRRAALDQLRDHVKPGTRVAAWFWVASGHVDFHPLDKARLRLDQNGIEFVGKKLGKKHLSKHLPAAKATASAPQPFSSATRTKHK